jgi:hypothetical protein
MYVSLGVVGLPSQASCVYICERKGTAINVQTEEQSTAGATETYQALSCNN